MKMHTNTECTLCRSRQIEVVVDLPKLPLTNIFLKEQQPEKYAGIDQAMQYCTACSHVQLMNVIDPAIVYDDTYFHRSSGSPIAKRGNDFFFNFMQRVTGGKKNRLTLEVGCNDLYLLKKMEGMSERMVGVDPILKGEVLDVSDTIRTVGKFVEELNFSTDVGGAPDLVLSVHTFEHISNPRAQFEMLVEHAAPDATFIIEVPGFDSLVQLGRYDQVFHQHLQYYSIGSMCALIEQLGCRYLEHTFNYNYWGGTMLVAFQKKKAEKADVQRITPAQVRTSYTLAAQRNAQFMAGLQQLGSQEKFVGFGAAQMLPTLAYQLKTDFAFLDAVLDDNQSRVGLQYPGMPVQIRHTSEFADLSNYNVIITAVDSTRPIAERLFRTPCKRILTSVHSL